MKNLSLCLSVLIVSQLTFGKESRRKRSKLQVSEELQEPSVWFPDWAPPDSDWSFNPLLGFKARSTEVGGVKTKTVATEGGAHLGIYNISLKPENPALQVSPHAGVAWGYMAQDRDSDLLSIDSKSSYTRKWYGLDLTAYFKFYRHQLGYHAGSIDYDKDFSKVQIESIVNDMGVMLVPHISLHLTSTFQTVFQDKKNEPILKEWNHWLHSKVAFRTFSSSLDFGPGSTSIDQYSFVEGVHAKQSSSSSTYILGQARAKFLWKLGLWANLKYIISADSDLSGSGTVIEQLPNQSLNEPTSVQSLPEDSLDTYLFVGIQNLFGGFGFGYRHSVLILNYGEKNDTERQVFRDSGYTVMYTLSL